MSDLALVIKYMFKETFNPSLHHTTFQEFIDDVESDVSKRTNDFKYVKYINFLNALNKQEVRNAKKNNHTQSKVDCCKQCYFRCLSDFQQGFKEVRLCKDS